MYEGKFHKKIVIWSFFYIFIVDQFLVEYYPKIGTSSADASANLIFSVQTNLWGHPHSQKFLASQSLI